MHTLNANCISSISFLLGFNLVTHFNFFLSITILSLLCSKKDPPNDLTEERVFNLKFEIEPGFFYGAMYVSYGLGIGLGSLILIISLAIFEMKNILVLSLIIGLSILILAPVNYFLSRLIWLNAFIDNKS